MPKEYLKPVSDIELLFGKQLEPWERAGADKATRYREPALDLVWMPGDLITGPGKLTVRLHLSKGLLRNLLENSPVLGEDGYVSVETNNFDRADTNNAIRLLRRARNACYGGDE